MRMIICAGALFLLSFFLSSRNILILYKFALFADRIVSLQVHRRKYENNLDAYFYLFDRFCLLKSSRQG
jgi:hypothetical protein